MNSSEEHVPAYSITGVPVAQWLMWMDIMRHHFQKLLFLCFVSFCLVPFRLRVCTSLACASNMPIRGKVMRWQWGGRGLMQVRSDLIESKRSGLIREIDERVAAMAV